MTSVINGDSDIQLMDQVRKGDAGALLAIYDCYAPSLFSLFSRVTGSTEAAEDLVRELFSRVWHYPHLFHLQKATLKSWLFALSKTLAVNHIATGAFPPVTSSNCRSTCVGLRDKSGVSGADISGLSKGEKLVLDLACYYSYSPREIAELVQSPLESVTRCLQSALIHARNRVDLLAVPSGK